MITSDVMHQCRAELQLGRPGLFLSRVSSGVAIDLECRVVDREQQPIPGLYAVGELTGLAGINGKAALEGTFLGPCIVTGRVAARFQNEQVPFAEWDLASGNR